MRRILPRCMVVAVLTPALLGWVALAHESPPTTAGWAVALGEPAPSFELPDVDGAPHRLEEFSGDPLVLIFWGTW